MQTNIPAIGARVRSKGALYIQSSNGYRKVHNGTVEGYQKLTEMGELIICKVITRYGVAFVNPSQLETVSL